MRTPAEAVTMNFEFEIAKLESLIKHGFIEQARHVGRTALIELSSEKADKEAAEVLLELLQANGISLESGELPVTQSCEIKIDDFVEEKTPGISIISACMNRNANLLKALKTWIALEEVDEILIVDWSSDRSVYRDIQQAGLLDPRVRVVRVDNQPRWVLTYAFNVGFRMARYSTILKADADITISKDFFERNSLARNQFVTGDWKIAAHNQEHINGFFFIHTEDLFKANGFNEFIDSYGWDDDDLYGRLEHLGMERVRVDASTIFHLHHEDAQRVGHEDKECLHALDELNQNTFYQIRKNRFIANSMPVWGRRSGHLQLTIREKSEQYFLLEQTRASFHIVADHVKQDAAYYAAVEIVSWGTSRRIYDLPKERFWSYLTAKKLDNMHRLDVSVMLHSERQLDYAKPSWMLNVYQDAFEAYFQRPEFLGSLNDFCRKKGLNVVLRINDPLFAHLSDLSQAYENIHAIPVSEAYGALDFLTTAQAIATIDHKRAMYFATNIRVEVMDALLQVLSGKPVTPETANIQVPLGKIFIDAQHGLGNRMRAIASGAVMAERSNRELVIVWQPDHHCEAGMLDLFNYKGALVEQAMVDDIPADTDFYNYMEDEPNSEKDAAVVLGDGRDVYVRTSCVVNSALTDWAKENEFLKSLQPIPFVLDLVKPFNLDGAAAVHIRMEGAAGLDSHSYERPENWSEEGLQSLRYWREKSHYSNFVARIDELIAMNKNFRFFLATDQAETYKIFNDLYGDRMMFLARDRFDRSKEQIQYALADAMLLSKCSRLVGSTWSSFTEIAMRLTPGFHSIEMSGKDF